MSPEQLAWELLTEKPQIRDFRPVDVLPVSSHTPSVESAPTEIAQNKPFVINTEKDQKTAFPTLPTPDPSLSNNAFLKRFNETGWVDLAEATRRRILKELERMHPTETCGSDFVC